MKPKLDPKRLTRKSKVDIHAFLKARMLAEFQFCSSRKWKFDYATLMPHDGPIPMCPIAIEIEGGIFNATKGRHTNPMGYLGDMEKYNEAAKRGWLVFRYAPWQFDLMIEQIGEMMGWVKNAKVPEPVADNKGIGESNGSQLRKTGRVGKGRSKGISTSIGGRKEDDAQ